MDKQYWHKQITELLYPNLLWARPEMKSAAGKLLIIGGHAQSFAVPAEAYTAAEKAGIGSARVMLPDVLERTVSKLFPGAEFAPSNLSGGFATSALAELLAAGQWADGVLLAGDLGRNSESLATLENFAGKYYGRLTITKDIADFFCAQPTSLVDRADTLLVISTGQLQKLGTSLHIGHAFTSDMGLVSFVELLHEFTVQHPNIYVVTSYQNSYVIGVDGHISTTAANSTSPVWRVRVAATSSTWWLQNPSKPFEALTTSVAPGSSL